MKFILYLIITCLCACGRPAKQVDSGDEQQHQADTPIEISETVIDQEIPVETLLVAPRQIPSRLNSKTLELSFRSNDPEARFQCAWFLEEFTTCESPFKISDLQHGKTYLLQVRAVSAVGDFDRSPLEVRFTADFIDGQTIEQLHQKEKSGNSELTGQENADDQVGHADDRDLIENRTVQIGWHHAVTIPYRMVVTSYATNKTFNTRLRTIRLLGQHGGSAYKLRGCQNDWEQLLKSGGHPYCDGTPTTEQLAAISPRHMPYNHVELVKGSEPQTSEKIFIAGFDDSYDPTEGHFTINDVCHGSVKRGRNALALVAKYYDLERDSEFFQWCQVQDSSGSFWWIGTFKARFRINDKHSRLRVIYTLKSSYANQTENAFIKRAETFLGKIIVPLTPLTRNP